MVERPAVVAFDIIELPPLDRSETILYNQLLAHAWNTIKTAPVHKALKTSSRRLS